MAGIDQSQVPDVLQVSHFMLCLGADQNRFDNPPHALFLQLVGQLVQMRAAREDEFLPRGVDVLLVNGARPIPPRFVVEAGAGTERVHQPGLALGLRPNDIAGSRA